MIDSMAKKKTTTGSGPRAKKVVKKVVKKVDQDLPPYAKVIQQKAQNMVIEGQIDRLGYKEMKKEEIQI